MTEAPSPRERLEAVERALRVQRALSAVACLVSAAAVMLALPALWEPRPPDLPQPTTASSPWTLKDDGTLVYDGSVWARSFVSMDEGGRRLAQLGVGQGEGIDAGAGLFVYDAKGLQPVAAVWRESFAGRSRMRIGDVGTNPIEVLGNGLDALLLAPNLRTYEPVITYRK